MGETLPLFRSSFNKSLRIEARPDRLTAEPGAIVLREIMQRTRIIEWLVERLFDPRDADKVTYPLADLLRTVLLLLGQGWRDQDDADALRHDAGLRLAATGARGTTALCGETHLASQPTLSRLIAVLSTPENRAVLHEAIIELAGRRLRGMRGGHRHRYLSIDVDSLPIEVHGHQPGSAWNGHYHQRMYHPLVASVAETGDILDARLRAGNVHTADGALDFILDLVDRAEDALCQVAVVRIDAGFPDDKLLGGLERRGTPYVARLRNNKVLDRMARPLLQRPPGRPPAEPRVWFHEMAYQAGSWTGTVLIRRTKTDQAGEGSVRFIAHDTCQHLMTWIEGAAIREGAVFRALSKGSVINGRLDGGEVSRIFKRRARAAGVDPSSISGHSSRVGAAQDLVAADLGVACQRRSKKGPRGGVKLGHWVLEACPRSPWEGPARMAKA